MLPPHRSHRHLVTVALLSLLVSIAQGAAKEEKRPSSDSEDKPLPTIALNAEGCSRHEGLLTVYLDPDRAKVYLELPPPTGPDREVGRFIYVEGLQTGLGSNPVGLDRGQIGASRLVVFRHIGRRLLVEQPNLSYRALSDSDAERAAVRESFATSILWAGDIVAQDPDGRSLVDFTPFVVRDAHNVASRLKRAEQGEFKLDKQRSVLDPDACLVFPDNIEFEALLTFESSEPGREVRTTAPTADAVTLIQHHSLLRLPDDGYKPRRFDPRAPSFAVHFVDYAAPLAKPLDVRWIARHRLEKLDPTAEKSKVKDPIVYYVDRGAPEPVRSALVEGASWWAKAFEAAGFIDAYRVELLPENAHPLDARYNVIQWVHRATRGWSYGNAITDPRTGEIIKGHVSLGSLRVRQDRLLFEGLAGTDHTGTGRSDDPVQLALARIRQLAAHEVGHTLGFTHNFAASTYAGRASVMDYPAPLVRIDDDGNLDFSDAYGVGVGAWDLFAVRYAYTQFPPGTDETEALDAMVNEALASGLLFLSDDDARPAGAADPRANLWDNGNDPVSELQHTLDVRRVALSKFGERNIQPGMPLSLLNEVLVPVYLYHRYQVAAAAKVLGGVYYDYAIRGDGQPPARPVETQQQTKALDTLLKCVSPPELDLPESVLAQLLPRPFGYSGNRELFRSSTAPTFDALGAAGTAADLVLTAILNPQRCARLIDQHRRDPRHPSLATVLETVVTDVFPDKPEPTERRAELRRTVQRVLVARLIQLASDPGTPPSVAANTDYALRDLRAHLSTQHPQEPTSQANIDYLTATIDRYLKRPMLPSPPPPGPGETPPGDPIGATIPNLARCSLAPILNGEEEGVARSGEARPWSKGSGTARWQGPAKPDLGGSRKAHVVCFQPPLAPARPAQRYNRCGPGAFMLMRGSHAISVLALLAGTAPLSADELLYSYEGDVVPYDASAGWVIANACEAACSESIQSDHFVLTWEGGSDIANYDLAIAESGEEPPPTLWVEWRFRSDHAYTTSPSCDGAFAVRYKNISDAIHMHGDTTISFGGTWAVFGLSMDQFHTYRFESTDGVNYTFAVDGDIFVDWLQNVTQGRTRLQLRGFGACTGNQVNEWDYVRYGTISSGEGIIASDPPAGILDPHTYSGLDRFSVTFSAPNFVYTDDITVEVTGGGDPPQVLRTWRRENDGPETLEVVLDRPIPLNETTRFIFNDGASENVISYTLRGVPAASAGTLVIMALLLVVAGTIVVAHRHPRLGACPSGAKGCSHG